MSVARAIELAEELRRLDASIMDSALGVERLEPILRRREEVVWSLRGECGADRLAGADAAERERLASLLRASTNDEGRLFESLGARRDRALIDFAATSRPRAADARPEPRFTERVA